MPLLSALTSEDRLVIGSMAAALVGVGMGALLAAPHFFGITALAVISLLIIGWRVTRGPRLAWLLLFGLVACILVLWVDWVHVVHFRSLVYTDYFGFRVLASPSYMPIGWWLTVVQFGYLALRLSDIWPRWVAVGLVTVMGMTVPPWYEEFAAPANAWYYTTSGPMLSHTPVWIIVTYGGCMFAVAVMALTYYAPRNWIGAVAGGIFTAAGIMLSGVIAYALLA